MNTDIKFCATMNSCEITKVADIIYIVEHKITKEVIKVFGFEDAMKVSKLLQLQHKVTLFTTDKEN